VLEILQNLATWTNTFKTTKVVYGVGKGVITTENGEMAIGLQMILDDLTIKA
jgi:hypothetical protein